MERVELIERIKALLSTRVVEVSEMPNDDVMVVVDRNDLLDAVDALKNDPTLSFNALLNQLGVDYGERMAVIYNIYSFKLRRRITVKAFLDREKPEVRSLEPVFKGINWYERETFDMFGIRFIGHSNLKRLLLPDDWEGHPLRKDYVYPEQVAGLDNAERGLIERTEGNGGN